MILTALTAYGVYLFKKKKDLKDQFDDSHDEIEQSRPKTKKYVRDKEKVLVVWADIKCNEDTSRT